MNATPTLPSIKIKRKKPEDIKEDVNNKLTKSLDNDNSTKKEIIEHQNSSEMISKPLDFTSHSLNPKRPSRTLSKKPSTHSSPITFPNNATSSTSPLKAKPLLSSSSSSPSLKRPSSSKLSSSSSFHHVTSPTSKPTITTSLHEFDEKQLIVLDKFSQEMFTIQQNLQPQSSSLQQQQQTFPASFTTNFKDNGNSSSLNDKNEKNEENEEKKFKLPTKRRKKENNNLISSNLNRSLNNNLKVRNNNFCKFKTINFPYELLIQIFSFLTWKELYLNLYLICKDWFNCINEYEIFIIGNYNSLDIFTNKNLIVCNCCNVELKDCKSKRKKKKEIYKNILQWKLEVYFFEYYLQKEEKYLQNNLQNKDAEENKKKKKIKHFNQLDKEIKFDIIQNLFPNKIKEIYGKGLTIPFIEMFQNTLQTIDMSHIKNTIVTKKPKKRKILQENLQENEDEFKFNNLKELICKNNESFLQNDFHEIMKNGSLNNLEKLNLSNNYRLNSNDFVKIFSKFCKTEKDGYFIIPKLMELNLSYCKLLDDISFFVFIESLDICYRYFKENYLNNLNNINLNNNINFLQKLNLSGCGFISGNSLRVLGEHFGAHITTLILDTPKNCKDINLKYREGNNTNGFCLMNFTNLIELSLQNNQTFNGNFSELIDWLINCPFNQTLQKLNIKGTSFAMSINKNVHVNPLLVGGILSSFSGISTGSGGIGGGNVSNETVEYKKQLVRLFRSLSKGRTQVSLVIKTDIGDYSERNSVGGLMVWQNLLPPHDNIKFKLQED
ncbi:hypothetical protein ABK040_003027 [Willaertia magna]